MRTRATLIVILLSLLALTPSAAAPSDSPLDTSAIYALLDVIDAIMAAHPDYESEAARIDALSGDARAVALMAKREANANNDDITAKIDALFATNAYPLYFAKFRFTKRETHRDILLALPYQAAPGPSDVSDNLKELCRHRAAVRDWVDHSLSQVDAAACVARAAEWLPPGDYRPVPVRFIYDGNGDAFNSFGGIVFDVFSVVFRFRPVATRFQALDGVGIKKMEKVIAHEYHHALKMPLSLKAVTVPDTHKRERRVAGSAVSEGVAMQCDLGPGLRRDVMEDPATIQWWIDALNEKLQTTRTGELSDDDWDAWMGSTYGDLAMDRLRDYLARTHPDADVDALARAQAASRPMLVYTLGWHMINRILSGPGGKAAVLALLESPHRVFAEYNHTLSDDETHLRIAPDVD